MRCWLCCPHPHPLVFLFTLTISQSHNSFIPSYHNPHTQKTADPFPTYPTPELTRDYSSFIQNPAGGGGGSSSQASSARVMELEAEVQRLREQLGKAKGINDAMWDTVVRRVVIEGGVKGKGGEAMEVDVTAD